MHLSTSLTHPPHPVSLTNGPTPSLYTSLTLCHSCTHFLSLTHLLSFILSLPQPTGPPSLSHSNSPHSSTLSPLAYLILPSSLTPPISRTHFYTLTLTHNGSFLSRCVLSPSHPHLPTLTTLCPLPRTHSPTAPASHPVPQECYEVDKMPYFEIILSTS
jgi:hypothetical protein